MIHGGDDHEIGSVKVRGADLRRAAPDFDAAAARAVGALATDGWIVLEEFVTVEFARALRRDGQRLLAGGSFRMAGIGRGEERRLRPDVRNDSVHWMEPRTATPTQALWLALAERLRLRLNEGLTLGLFDYEVHLAVYPVGGAYQRHRDQFAGAAVRVLTTTLYLNDDWNAADGGALRLYVADDRVVDVLPRAGTLALFLSNDFDHEVQAARRERWSATGWFRRRA